MKVPNLYYYLNRIDKYDVFVFSLFLKISSKVKKRVCVLASIQNSNSRNCKLGSLKILIQVDNKYVFRT